MWDELPSGPKPKHDVRSWTRFITEAGAASASFLLALTVFSVAGLNALQGSKIVVLSPEQVLFYRDVGARSSVLLVAMPVRMINAAGQDYGDVVVSATAHLGGPDARNPAEFEYQAIVEPVFTANAAEQARACGVGVNCVATDKLLVAERPKRLLDVPGGSSRSEFLSFRLQSHLCSGSPSCARYSDYRSVMQLLQNAQRLQITVKLRLNSDGEHSMVCVIDDQAVGRRQAWIDYLEEEGWANLPCEQASRPS